MRWIMKYCNLFGSVCRRGPKSSSIYQKYIYVGLACLGLMTLFNDGRMAVHPLGIGKDSHTTFLWVPIAKIAGLGWLIFYSRRSDIGRYCFWKICLALALLGFLSTLQYLVGVNGKTLLCFALAIASVCRIRVSVRRPEKVLKFYNGLLIVSGIVYMFFPFLSLVSFLLCGYYKQEEPIILASFLLMCLTFLVFLLDWFLSSMAKVGRRDHLPIMMKIFVDMAIFGDLYLRTNWILEYPLWVSTKSIMPTPYYGDWDEISFAISLLVLWLVRRSAAKWLERTLVWPLVAGAWCLRALALVLGEVFL